MLDGFRMIASSAIPFLFFTPPGFFSIPSFSQVPPIYSSLEKALICRAYIYHSSSLVSLRRMENSSYHRDDFTVLHRVDHRPRQPRAASLRNLAHQYARSSFFSALTTLLELHL